MLYFIVSHCKHQNFSNTKHILDMFAHRTGERSWSIRTSQLGINTIASLLKRHASRGTSVVAWRVDGASHKKLSIAFTVGSKTKLNNNGDYAIHSRKIVKEIKTKHNIRSLLTVVHTSGLFHDIGKSTDLFQDQKIKKGLKTASEPWRHELLSLYLLRLLENGVKPIDIEQKMNVLDLKTELKPYLDEMSSTFMRDWLILSHHKLPDRQFMTRHAYMHGDQVFDREKDFRKVNLGWLCSEQLKKKSAITTNHVNALYARFSFICADHLVSSLKKEDMHSRSWLIRHLSNIVFDESSACGLMANQSQTLENHLRAVAAGAKIIARFALKNNLSDTLPCLDSGLIYSQAGTEGKFAWQRKAVDLILDRSKNTDALFVVVASETGSGKTKACAAIADAICAGFNQPSRFTIALGLRSLTLQTGDSYRHSLNLSDDQLLVQIGSKEILELHDLRQEQEDSEIENSEYIFDQITNEFMSEPLVRLFDGNNQKNNINYLSAPVLVSTIDSIIDAASFDRSKFLRPIMRCSSGPVVIDEIDNFNKNDLIVIARFMYFLGLIGQSVVISSATIYPSIGEEMFAQWSKGYQLHRQEFHRRNALALFVYNDYQANRSCDEDSFNSVYSAFLSDIAQKNIDKTQKRLGLVLARCKSLNETVSASFNHIRTFHENYGTLIDGVIVSIGVVRFYRISDVVHYAKTLDDLDHGDCLVKILTYHANYPIVVRSNIEKILNNLLNRTKRTNAPYCNEYTESFVREAKSKGKSNVIIIVVASPVEETGMDHDFDWAVTEATSARSIVQIAGRVYRHRECPENVVYPNVLIMPDIKGAYDTESLKLWDNNYITAKPCLIPDNKMGGSENSEIKESFAKNSFTDENRSFYTNWHYRDFFLRKSKEQSQMIWDVLDGKMYSVEDKKQSSSSTICFSSGNPLKNGFLREDVMLEMVKEDFTKMKKSKADSQDMMIISFYNKTEYQYSIDLGFFQSMPH